MPGGSQEYLPIPCVSAVAAAHGFDGTARALLYLLQELTMLQAGF